MHSVIFMCFGTLCNFSLCCFWFNDQQQYCFKFPPALLLFLADTYNYCPRKAVKAFSVFLALRHW